MMHLCQKEMLLMLRLQLQLTKRFLFSFFVCDVIGHQEEA